jgi:hypothetical protein
MRQADATFNLFFAAGKIEPEGLDGHALLKPDLDFV